MGFGDFNKVMILINDNTQEILRLSSEASSINVYLIYSFSCSNINSILFSVGKPTERTEIIFLLFPPFL